MRKITCTCEKSFDADVPDSIDLAKNIKVLDEILSGTFLTISCPHCGSIIKPEFPLTLINSETDTSILMIPEVERNQFLLGRTEYGDHDRVVIGYPELVEKLQVREAHLDDRAVELIKYYLLVKAGTGVNPKIFFTKMENQALVFEISGLKTDEIGVARIPLDLYKASLNDLTTKAFEEPFKIFLEPPYISITKVELED